MKKVIRAATTFEDEVMSNPTWQMANRICQEHGYRFDPYARVIVLPSGEKYIEPIKIVADDSNRPVIYAEFDGRVLFELDIRGNEGQSFISRNAVEDYITRIQDAIDLTYELEDINFWDLYESEEEF